MSASGREVAHRIFAAEYDDSTHSYSESEEERAPNYVVTPTGARVNRLFFVGVLTEVESVSEEVLRGRVADPTGVFVLYAGQYQPDEMAFLEDAEPPLFVAVTGKARTFSPDDSDRVFTSVRPESINAVDADTRDRWTVEAAEDTLARVATARAAMDLDLSGEALTAALREAGVADDLADGIPRAFAAYGTTEHYLATVADLAVDALELVAGEAEEVPGLSVAPDDPGDGTVDPASFASIDGAVVDLDASAPAVDGSTPADPEPASSSAAAEGVGSSVDDAGTDTDVDDVGTGSEPEEVAAGSEVDDVATASTEPADEATPPESGAHAEDDTDDEIGDFEPTDSSVDTADEVDETGADDDEIGEFEPSATATTDDAAADEMPAEDVLDDEERERLEEEYGTFESGTEVPEPGEADIEPEAGPIEPDEIPDEATADVAAEGESESEAADPAESEADDADEETETEPDDGTAGEEDVAAGDPDEADEAADQPDEDVDVDEALMELMDDLDDGDGADREALVAAVVDEYGVDPGAVEDAIQDALMAGKCYEPDDAHVKPI